jgi:hypothetical protein
VKVDAGHGDLLVGRKAPEDVWPLVGNWLEARCGFIPHPVTELADESLRSAS